MSNTGQPSTRLFSDYYDSVQQRKRRDLSPPAFSSLDALRGRIRLDLVRFERLVVTDAQLLDGAAFLSVDPRQLCDSIRRKDDEPAALEVRARSKTLPESLIAFVKGPETLRAVTFSSVEDPGARTMLYEQLPKFRSDRVSDWRDVPAVLREVGLDAVEADRLEQAWGAWFAAERAGIIDVQPWDRRPSFTELLERALAREEPGTVQRDRLVGPGGRLHLEYAWDHRTDRNTVERYLQSREQSADPELALDLMTIRDWLYRAYNRALAIQHGCAFDSTYPNDVRPARPVHELADAAEEPSWPPEGLEPLVLELPEEFLGGLGTMTAAGYREALSDPRILDGLRRWWHVGSLDDLRAAVELVAGRVPGGWAERAGLAESLIIVGSAALGGGIGATAADPFTGILVGGGTALAERTFFVWRHLATPQAQIARRIVEYESQRTHDDHRPAPTRPEPRLGQTARRPLSRDPTQHHTTRMNASGPPPIRRIHERLEYTNPWLRLYFDDVEKPDGPSQYTRIEEGAPGAGPGVVVIPRDPAGLILFIRSYRYPVGEWLWELPRGFGEPGQSAVESAARELEEETGLRAESYEELGVLFPNTGLLASRISIVLARGVAGTATLQGAEAIDSSRWLSPAEAMAEAASGALRDGISLAALFHLAGYDQAAAVRE